MNKWSGEHIWNIHNYQLGIFSVFLRKNQKDSLTLGIAQYSNENWCTICIIVVEMCINWGKLVYEYLWALCGIFIIMD